jgi:alkanesulfonate monooxygenase SsuD/methylene tetrahydromethanopterin reductase-like flavin-dependent oxidoreductase (luciferase family)
MMGRLLAEWDDKPFGCLFLLPLWHPVLLAEQIGTLASIGQGRFIMQCGLGYGEEQFQALGTTMRHRPSRFEESLDILRRLLAGETVSSDGRWKIRDASISPIPPEPVEVWVAASAPVAIERAGRLGDGFLAAPSLPPAEARMQLQLYREACEKADRPVGTLAVRRDIFVGETSEEAVRIGGAIVERGYRGFPKDAPVYGSPGEVAEKFGELAEMGYTDVIVRSMAGRQEQALSSLGLLKEVREKVGSEAPPR